MATDYYDVLEISPEATDEEIKEQFRLLISAWHPDKFRSKKQKQRAEKRTKLINEAYDTLRSSQKRAAYDRQRAEARGEHSRAEQDGRQKQSDSKSNDQQQQNKQQTHQAKNEYEQQYHARAATAEEVRRQQAQRAGFENDLESQARLKWEQKVAKGAYEFKGSKNKKSGFFGNLFNKGKCLVGAHDGDWFRDRAEHCTEVRVCELCQNIDARTVHDWRPWQFQMAGSCLRQRECRHCGAQDLEFDHNWSYWEYLGANTCTQAQICTRCQARSDHTREQHQWGDWSIDQARGLRIRSCQRCHEQQAQQLEIRQPAIAAHAPSINGIWVAGDGLPVQFNQLNNQLTFRGTNQFGAVTVDGTGVINGNLAQLAFRYFDGTVYDEAQAQMQISADGRRMEGMVYYAYSGVSRAMALVKQY